MSALVLLVLLVVAVAVIILLSCLLCKAKRPTMMQAPSEASQITGSSNDTAGTILEARDIAGTIPEARYTTVTGMSNTNLVYASRNPRNCLGLFRVPQFAKNEDVSRHGILQQICPFLS